VTDLSGESWFINAMEEAMTRMNNPIFGNIMLLGALSGTDQLPLNREGFKSVISQSMTPNNVILNLTAYDQGITMVS